MRAKTVDAAAAGDTCRLFTEILNSGANLRMRVTGPSMAPLLRNNDLVTVRKIAVAELKSGDIVLFINHSSAPVVHRIIKKRLKRDRACFHTKGDARLEYDQWIDGDRILGKICRIEKVRPPRHIDLQAAPWRIASRLMAIFQMVRSKILLSIKARLKPVAR